ncbi:MAG: VWA domain-containing protein [Clostridiales bacterium]|nr:VWA domain-containing protein [Clostridiales bacterium]
MKMMKISAIKCYFSFFVITLLVATSIIPNSVLLNSYADDDNPILTVTSHIETNTILIGDVTRVNINVQGNNVVVEERRPLDIILVMDASGSMAWDMQGNTKCSSEFSGPNRMKFAEDAAISFIRDSALSDDINTRVGIVSFGTRWSRGSHIYESQIEPLKSISDYGGANYIRNAIRNPGGGTALGEPVYEAIAMLNASESHNPMQVIVMMTDGEHNPGRGREPADAADFVMTNDMIMHTVGFGSGVADDRLRDLAYRANGSFHSAPTGVSLGQVFDSLATTLRELVAENIVVTYELTDDVEYVLGSANVEPTINGRILSWNLGRISKDELKSISFDVRPLIAGNNVAINTSNSQVTYNNDQIQLAPLVGVEVLSGQINIDLKDIDGIGIDGVGILISNTTTGEDFSGVTNSLGIYQKTDLSSGNYEVTIDPPDGYKLSGTDVFHLSLSIENIGETLSVVLEEAGRISVDVKDIHGDGIEGAEVLITNLTTATDLPAGITDANGAYSKIDLSFDNYEVTIVPPAGYRLIGSGVHSLALNATRPFADITVEMELYEIRNAKITGFDDRQEVDSVVDGVVNAKISFDLLKDIDSIKILLNMQRTDLVEPEDIVIDILSISVVHIDEHNNSIDGEITVTNNELSILSPASGVTGSLLEGSYIIDVMFRLRGISPDVDFESGQIYSIDIKTIETVIGVDSNVFSIDDEAAVIITIVDDPGLH